MEAQRLGKISIVMAAYNAEKVIGSAIKSVLRQTYTDFELIVAEDGSTDKTAAIVEQMAQGDSRIRLLRNGKNRGVSYTRKYAAEMACGNWIAILDSDDIWQPEKLEKQVNLQQQTNADLIYTGSAFMNAQGDMLDWEMHVPATVNYKKLLKQNIISNSSALVRRELYLKYYASEDGMHEDFALWLSMLKDGKQARGIDEPLLVYRLSKNSKSGNKIKAAKMNWKTYHYVNLNPLAAAYYEMCYVLNGIRKYAKLSQ